MNRSIGGSWQVIFEPMAKSNEVFEEFIESFFEGAEESLNDTNAKRSVAVSALMVNLAIDFLAKDDKEEGFPINKQA